MNRLLRQLLLGFSCLALFAATTAKATTWTVNSTADPGVGSVFPSGSLRWCMNNAASGDTIQFNVTGTITLGSALPTVTKNLTITGPGASLLTISGNNQYQVFSIPLADGGVTVHISNLTIANGSDTDGGAISLISGNDTLTVNNCTFNGNNAGKGGAIYNYGGELTVTACTFSNNGNVGTGLGGAIYNYGNFGEVLTLTACTFNGNIGFQGGAIYNDASGNLTATNCTFSGNVADGGIDPCLGQGGAIYNDGPLTLIACTISGNNACAGGALYLQVPASIGNCIIAGNSGFPNVNSGPDIYGTFTSLGFNLFGIMNGPQGQISESPTAPGHPIGYDMFGSSAFPWIPDLGPLADNGGPTYTMALLEPWLIEGTNFVRLANPAIDQGNRFGATTDQRGYTRPVNYLGNPVRPGGDYSDIGAYEVQIPFVRGWQPCIPCLPFHMIYKPDFVSVAGASNTVQTTDDLVSGNWSNLPGSFVGNGGIMELDITNSSNVAQQFYRVATSVQGEVYVPPLADIDSTIDPAYSNAWTSGSDGVQGFGLWLLSETSTNINNDGFLIGSSTNNGPGAHVGIDVAGNSWGLYANSGNLAVAYRAFSNSLAAGEIVGVDMDNGYINASGTVGFVLRNGNFTSSPTNYTTGARLQFLYIGNDSSNSYKVVDSGGQRNVGVPFTSTGLHLVFTLNTTNTYTLLTIDNASGATNGTVTGTLAGSGTVDSIALFNNNAGPGSANDCFFNSLQTVGP